MKQRADGWRDGERVEVVERGKRRMEGEWRQRRGRRRHPVLDAKQRVGQMNIEVLVSRTGRRLETDGLTHRLEARERSGWREGQRYYGYILSNCQVKFRQTFKMSQTFIKSLFKANYIVSFRLV